MQKESEMVLCVLFELNLFAESKTETESDFHFFYLSLGFNYSASKQKTKSETETFSQKLSRIPFGGFFVCCYHGLASKTTYSRYFHLNSAMRRLKQFHCYAWDQN